MKRWAWKLIIGMCAVLIMAAVGLWLVGRSAEYETFMLPRPMQSPLAINDAGQVAGSGHVDGMVHALVWDPAQGVHDLGAFGFARARAVDINDRGQVLIWAEDSNDIDHAFVWNPDTGARQIGHSPGLGFYPRAMNNHGQIVGALRGDRSTNYPAVWDPENGIRQLDAMGSSNGGAEDINDKGQIVGWVQVGVRGPFHSVLWGPGAEPVDLNAATTADGMVLAINEAGVAVGRDRQRGAEYHTGVVWDLAKSPRAHRAFSGPAIQINNRGQILGLELRGGRFRESVTRDFLFDPDRGKLFLERSAPRGWRVLQAYDVNNHGWITVVLTDKEDGLLRRPAILKPLRQAED